MFSSRLILKRGANFTAHERDVLVECIKAYRFVVEDKRTDGKSVYRKQKGWEHIMHIYNSNAGVTKRTVKQLRSAWKNWKHRYPLGEDDAEHAGQFPEFDDGWEHVRGLSLVDSSTGNPGPDEDRSDDDSIDSFIDKALKVEPVDNGLLQYGLKAEPMDSRISYPREPESRNRTIVEENGSKVVVQKVPTSITTAMTSIQVSDNPVFPVINDDNGSQVNHVPTSPTLIQTRHHPVTNIPNSSLMTTSPSYQLVIPKVQSTSIPNTREHDVKMNSRGRAIASKHFKKPSLMEVSYRRFEHLEKMKTLRLERTLMRKEHVEKMAVYRVKREYYEYKKRKLDFVTSSDGGS